MESDTGLSVPAAISRADSLPIAGLAAIGSLLAPMPAFAAFGIRAPDTLGQPRQAGKTARLQAHQAIYCNAQNSGSDTRRKSAFFMIV